MDVTCIQGTPLLPSLILEDKSRDYKDTTQKKACSTTTLQPNGVTVCYENFASRQQAWLKHHGPKLEAQAGSGG